MNRLVIELPEHAYKQLMKRAEKQHKPPEKLARERLIAEFGKGVRAGSQAKQIARDYLTACMGPALAPQTPTLDKRRAIWCVPVAIELLVEGWTEVGTLEINAKTGAVLEESPSSLALLTNLRKLMASISLPAKGCDYSTHVQTSGIPISISTSAQGKSRDIPPSVESQRRNFR